MFLNTQISRLAHQAGNNHPSLLPQQINFVQLALCSSYQHAPGGANERNDLGVFTYLGFLENYVLNRGDLIGVAGPPTVYLKHNPGNMLLNDNPSVFAVPAYNIFRGVNNYETLCTNYYNNNHNGGNSITDFTNQHNLGIAHILNNAIIQNPQEAFNSVTAFKNFFDANGPFIMRITVSARGNQALTQIKTTNNIQLITAANCN
jgi:hypothetical protein